jgi:hypothetical protein
MAIVCETEIKLNGANETKKNFKLFLSLLGEIESALLPLLLNNFFPSELIELFFHLPAAS